MQPATPSTPEAAPLRGTGVSPAEWPALGWSFLYFFSLLAAYYVLRPVRDAVGTPYVIWTLFLATFTCMLLLVPAYGALVARFPRRTFIPVVYLFFIACLGGFYALMQSDAGGKWRDAAFFVWVAVFNLFAVSVFWSFMSDIFEEGQAKRFYGAIAAGGTAGTLFGSFLVISLVRTIGMPNMMLVSAALLGVCLVAVMKLVPWARQQEALRGGRSREDAIGGSIFGGAMLIFRSRFLLACCGLMFFGVAVGTLLYNHQQAFARIEFLDDREARTAFFGTLDLAINVLVLATQLVVTRVLLTRFGVAPMLLVPATLVGLGFIAIGIAPHVGFDTQRLTINVLFATFTLSGAQLLLSLVQIVTRAGNFALIQPARESLFTVVDREARYKSKNFIDTVVYRGGDLSFAIIYAVMTQALGFGGGGVAVLGALMALALVLSAAAVVREHRQVRAHADAAGDRDAVVASP